MKNTEQSLIEDARRGQRSAFEEILRQYLPLVDVWVFRKLGAISEREDLVQDIFVRAWRNLGQLRETGKFAQWLNGIANRTCLNWLRERQRKNLPLTEAAHSAVTEEKNSQDDLLGALQSLPEKFQEVLMMFYMQGMNYEQIAKSLGLAKPTVNLRLSQAREMLRQKLEALKRTEA